MAKLIVEEMSLGDMVTLLKLRKGDVELVEEKITESARVNGKAIRDIQWPPHCTVAAAVSYTHLTLPTSDLV